MKMHMDNAPQSVKVAVNIRPLISQEKLAACQECLTVAHGEPQIIVYPDKSFTFDHVYGSCGSSSENLFEECVHPLVDGLFKGYNATVLAYGQTGSGKTYTMGTAYSSGGSSHGVIPRAMQEIFSRVELGKGKLEFQLRVSFIEIHREDIRDLLDPSSTSGNSNGKNTSNGRNQITIRETGPGGITLSGVTEISVLSLEEMADCLERGSLCRATASTNMNAQSSRSHAIFTITLEQKRKVDIPIEDLEEESGEDFLCAKLHLVDLAGSERVKKTKADGQRLIEGIHINKGLLALGNVISALGDEKKKKETTFVPYRDSKLTRLLQDSLGGNSRTVMIACVSPADINMDETLNTLKYANRARNIQNKPVVNRDPMAAEVQRLRHQVQLLQAELALSRASGTSLDSLQQVAVLESENTRLKIEVLQLTKTMSSFKNQMKLKAEKMKDWEKISEEELKKEISEFVESFEKMDSSENLPGKFSVLGKTNLASTISENCGSEVGDFPLSTTMNPGETLGDCPSSIGQQWEDRAKELAFQMQQDQLQQELQELNQKLENKEEMMRGIDKSMLEKGSALRHHFEKKLKEIEEEKSSLQKQRDKLILDLERTNMKSDEKAKVQSEAFRNKICNLEKKIETLKTKQMEHRALLKSKQKSEELSKHLQEEIQRMKTNKVQLQRKLKQESDMFHAWKLEREKEVLQLKKEGRRTEYEMHKLQALHERQKMVLHRKTEEAAQATKRLKEVLEARRAVRETISHGSVSAHLDKQQHAWIESELAILVGIHQVRRALEREVDRRASLGKELDILQKEESLRRSQPGSPWSNAGMSPRGRKAKTLALQAAITASSQTIISMQQQLSEAEERERASEGNLRFQRVRNFNEARNLLQILFSSAGSARCDLYDEEVKYKDMCEQNEGLKSTLTDCEERLKDLEIEKQMREISLKENSLESEEEMEIDGTKTPGGLWKAASEGLRNLKTPHIDEMGLEEITPIQKTRGSFPSDMSETPVSGIGSINVTALSSSAKRPMKRSPLGMALETPKFDEESSSDMEIDDERSKDPDYDPLQEILKISEQRAIKGHRNSKLGTVLSGKTLLESNPSGGFKDPFSGPFTSCNCQGKCSRKCGCKAEGVWCTGLCGCKSSKCVNRETSNVDPSAVATAVTKELTDAAKAVGLLGDGKVEEESIKEAREILAKHGAQMKRAFEAGLRKQEENQKFGATRKPLFVLDENKISSSEKEDNLTPEQQEENGRDSNIPDHKVEVHKTKSNSRKSVSVAKFREHHERKGKPTGP